MPSTLSWIESWKAIAMLVRDQDAALGLDLGSSSPAGTARPEPASQAVLGTDRHQDDDQTDSFGSEAEPAVHVLAA